MNGHRTALSLWEPHHRSNTILPCRASPCKKGRTFLVSSSSRGLPRDAPPCHALSAVPHLVFLRAGLSRHAVLEQVTARVRRGRAHPSAQGQSFILKPPSLLFFYIDPRRRVSAPSTARRAARLCGPAFMPCISFSCRCSCMQLQPGQAHPSAGARAVTCVVSPCTQEACRVEPRAVRLAWVP
jgi:hypothetical protein